MQPNVTISPDIIQLSYCLLFFFHYPKVRQHMAMKVILNAHSTCIMGRLGRLVGNTMTNVSPSNLKLIGRATYLILLHVNAALEAKQLEVSFRVLLKQIYFLTVSAFSPLLAR